jgi:hypothetical protein
LFCGYSISYHLDTGDEEKFPAEKLDIQDIWWNIELFIFGLSEITAGFSRLLCRLFSHCASASQRVTSTEEGKNIDDYPICSALAGSIRMGSVRR